ncbi:OTU domain-containing protein 3 [Cyrtonyx montezumae]|uniref:OTU domain-containing protein 3 n=1 Tax=Cyrtonyx montezumae TaxID=9017 RepID=UPI0032DA1933
MSRQQAVRTRPVGLRKVQRPRQPRSGAASKPSEGCGGLAKQLRALGLKLREVPGDGNCLFRALGDQLEGHSRDHLRHRQETVEYMIKHREDFEPFVEDDVPFEKHVTSLAQPGTFAGNDAIVAFARNNQINVVIHQLNAPLWQIQGTDKSNARELHIAYQHGEHYDSVRRINDDSEAPAYLRMEMLPRSDLNEEEEIKQQKDDSEVETEVEMEAAIQEVCSATGCSDVELVSQVLKEEDCNIESAIFTILQVKEEEIFSAEEQSDPQNEDQKSCASAACETYGNKSLHHHEMGNNKGQVRADGESQANKNSKVSKKQKREQQQLEKKKRQEERHQQKVLASKSNCADNSRKEVDSDNQITLVKTVAALNL